MNTKHFSEMTDLEMAQRIEEQMKNHKPAAYNLPYPWCMQPEVCKHKGYCPRDPNCGE